MRKLCLLTTLVLSLVPAIARAQDADKLPTIASKVERLQKIDGFIPLDWQASTGNLLMDVGRWNEQILYYTSLPGGLGSSPVGLDRGQIGLRTIVKFERVGPKVLLVQPNYKFRAITSNEAERRSVADSFAQSV